MGIFSKLAGLVTKKEKSKEEKLLIGALVNLKKALKQIEKTIEKVSSFEKKLLTRKTESLTRNEPINFYVVMEEGIGKVIDHLRFTDYCLKSIEYKIITRGEGGPKRYYHERPEKERLILHLVTISYNRIEDLNKHYFTLKDIVESNSYKKKSFFMNKLRYYKEFLLKNKQAIENSIKDLENYLASS